jgi:exodeoxyribonuclease V alpha subunit
MAYVVGTVRKLKFYNEVSDWSVVQLKGPAGDLFIATGEMGAPNLGYELELTGQWVANPHGGREQFKVSVSKVKPPSSEEGIFLFLTSGLFKGLTKKIGRGLVDAFGKKTIGILDTDINVLNMIEGVGPRKFIQIRDSYKETKPQQEKVWFLMDAYQFSFAESLEIVNTFPQNTLKLLEKSPYSLYRQLHKIPFVRFDRIILGHGHPKDDPQRIRGVLQYYMKANYSSGHTVTSRQQLVNFSTRYSQLDAYTIEKELNWLISRKWLFEFFKWGRPVLQSKWLYLAEKEIATRLDLIDKTSAEKEIIFDDTSASLNHLKPQQRVAVSAPFRNKVSIITGKPGTGKTTLLRSMLDLLEGQNLKVMTCTPTGKAAQRMREVTGRDSMTIHRALGATHKSDEYIYNDINPLDVDVVLVDEMSMVDTPLLRSLLRAIPFAARIVLIGDPNQLPSVGVGAIFRDLILSGCISVDRLTQVLRITKDDGSIPTPLQFADLVLEGKFSPPENDDEWEYVPTKNNKETKHQVLNIVSSLIKKGMGYNDIQVFSPVNEDEVGVTELNTLVKDCFFPNSENTIQVGDKVMQRENNYTKNVYNGDVGIVREINKDVTDPEGTYLVMEKDKELLEYTKKEAYNLQLSYTITGHKSQGSEYPVIIIVVPDHYFSLMDRYWLYTLVTRCQKKAYLVGVPGVTQKTITSKTSHLRKTLLVDRLQQYITKS